MLASSVFEGKIRLPGIVDAENLVGAFFMALSFVKLHESFLDILTLAEMYSMLATDSEAGMGSANVGDWR